MMSVDHDLIARLNESAARWGIKPEHMSEFVVFSADLILVGKRSQRAADIEAQLAKSKREPGSINPDPPKVKPSLITDEDWVEFSQSFKDYAKPVNYPSKA
jgi:hypothetical protein